MRDLLVGELIKLCTLLLIEARVCMCVSMYVNESVSIYVCEYVCL